MSLSSYVFLIDGCKQRLSQITFHGRFSTCGSRNSVYEVRRYRLITLRRRVVGALPVDCRLIVRLMGSTAEVYASTCW
jgi:hypothetical protein